MLCSGEARGVEGISSTLSVGQPLWAPATNASQQHLVVVGWSAEPRKLGMKYCTNRPCALYSVACPFNKSKAIKTDQKWVVIIIIVAGRASSHLVIILKNVYIWISLSFIYPICLFETDQLRMKTLMQLCWRKELAVLSLHALGMVGFFVLPVSVCTDFFVVS